MTTCFKHCYATRREAKHARRELNKKYEQGLTSIYWCEACSNYHLTSMPKSTRKEMRQRNAKRIKR